MSFDNRRKDYDKEHLWIVEMDVDGTIYRFCENRSPVPAGLIAQPTLKTVRVSPAEIDLKGGIGVRAKASLTLSESEDYTTWGTVSNPVRFWSRWRAENPYYLGQRISVLSGYIVDGAYDEDNFIRRDYIIESFAQTGGGVSITGKDPLKLANNDRAKAPRESTGSLLGPLSIGASTFDLQPSGVGSEYPSSNGIVRIGDEVISYTSRSGDTISGATRGAFNTEETDHDDEDAVQLCLYFDSETVSDIDYELLTTYANVPTSYINKSSWDGEVSAAFPVTYTALITEPTGVQELLKEFAESAPHYLYWDERVNRIQLKSLRPPPEDAPLINYQGNILKGTTTVQDKQDMRVSTVIVNFGIFDPTKDLDEVSNYRASYVREDSDSVTNYGQRAYRKINSRWISSDNKTAAVLMAARIGRRFSEAPRMVGFELDAKDADVWTGDSLRIQTDLIEQAGGGFPSLFYQVLSAGEARNYNYMALEHTYGPPVAGDEDVEDPNVRLIYISGNQDRLSDPEEGSVRTLRALYEDIYGGGAIDPDLDIRFIFESNAVAGSSINGIYAVRTGDWAVLNTPPMIVNNGLIVGKGGDGADVGGSPGDGSGAIQLESDIRLDNSSTIGGGGAGGDFRTEGGAQAAGGGGGGYVNGEGGSGTTYSPTGDATGVTQAQDGTNTTGGAGGSASGNTGGEPATASGESGGDLGQDTSTANAGKAIDLNGFTVTYINTGTILGDVS